MSERFDDQAKINFVKTSLTNTCYTTDHLNSLLLNLSTQNGRNKMVKELYPQLADQANINRLYKHFSFKSYREKLSELGR